MGFRNSTLCSNVSWYHFLKWLYLPYLGHRNELWSFDINPEETRMITGSVDTKLRLWTLNEEEFSQVSDDLIASWNEDGVADSKESVPEEENKEVYVPIICSLI